MHRQSSSVSSPVCSPICSPISLPSLSPSLLLSLSPPPTYRLLSPPPPTYKVIKNYLTVEDLYIRYTPRYLKMDDLFRMFRRRSAASTSAAPTVALKHLSIRYQGRYLAKKGDGSTQTPKHLPKHLPKQQQNQKQKIYFTRTPLQLTLYKSILLLWRSRSTLPLPASGHRYPISSMPAPKRHAYTPSASLPRIGSRMPTVPHRVENR